MVRLTDYLRGESKYLKAEDLPEGAEVRLTIDRVEIETLEHGDGRKDRDAAVLYFKNKERGLVLNYVNGKRLTDAYGEESDNCIGQVVLLYRDTTQFKGQTVPCLRLRIPVEEMPADGIPF